MTAVAFTRFFQRAVTVSVKNPLLGVSKVEIKNLKGDGLHISFDIARTNKPQPDEGTVRIYNLSPTTIGRMHAAYKSATEIGFRRPSLELELNAGYEGIVSPMFKGDVWNMRPRVREGSDWYTEFQAADGGDAFRGGAVNASVGGVDYRTLIGIVTKAMNIKTSAQAEASLAAAGANVRRLEGGVVIQDTARAALDRLTKDLDLTWWIKDGQLVIVKRVTTDVAVVLTPNTGLLNFDLVRSGDIEGSAMLNPLMFPGRQLLVQDRFFRPVGEPAYRIESTAVSGASWGGDWDTNFVGRGVRLL